MYVPVNKVFTTFLKTVCISFCKAWCFLKQKLSKVLNEESNKCYLM